VISLLDDHLLSRVMRGESIPELDGWELATTGLWYYRLCLAVERDAGGVLSDQFAALEESLRAEVFDRLRALPDLISVLPIRALAPIMARQSRVHSQLNLLAREALAAAAAFPARVVVRRGNIGPHLRAALERDERTLVEVA
jgi:hypothetical protein